MYSKHYYYFNNTFNFNLSLIVTFNSSNSKLKRVILQILKADPINLKAVKESEKITEESFF